jgi:hypothetical protein
MKRLPKVGLLLAVALLTMAAAATSAQAVRFSPNATAVSGTATNPTLNYSGVTVTCAQGTVNGTTGTNSPIIDNALVNFTGPCNVSGQAATVNCNGTDGNGSPVDLVAQFDVAPGGTGTVELEPTFRCVVSVGVACTITVLGTENVTTQDENITLDEGADETTADVTVFARKVGSSACGSAASGDAGFNAVYDTTPSNLEIIDP